MIRSALEFLSDKFVKGEELKEYKHDGKTYINKQLQLLTPSSSDSLLLSTLTSLSDYINEGIDKGSRNQCVIAIDSHQKVRLYSYLDKIHLCRNLFCTVTIDGAEVRDGFASNESFQIFIRSNFEENEDKIKLLENISSIKVDESHTIEDTGVGQETFQKQGISLSTVEREKLQQYYNLKPFVTFPEIDQPEVKYLLRVTKDGDLGLFEADGNRWQLKTKLAIKEWLASHTKESGIPILA